MPPTRFTTVEEYIASLPSEKADVIGRLRELLRATLPDAEETISYSMPAFRQNGIVVWYAAAKNHYALYVYPRVKAVFTADLAEFSGTKSAIHFDYSARMPAALIGRIAKESLRQNLVKPVKALRTKATAV